MFIHQYDIDLSTISMIIYLIFAKSSLILDREKWNQKHSIAPYFYSVLNLLGILCLVFCVFLFRPIPTRDCVTKTVQYIPDGTPIIQLEHVQLYVKLDHTRRGDVQIYLTSPSKTVSEMLSTRKNDNARNGIDFTFMTVHNWGENPSGDWEVKVCDNRKSTSENIGKLEK